MAASHVTLTHPYGYYKKNIKRKKQNLIHKHNKPTLIRNKKHTKMG